MKSAKKESDSNLDEGYNQVKVFAIVVGSGIRKIRFEVAIYEPYADVNALWDHAYNLMHCEGYTAYNMYHALDLTAKLVVKEEDPLNEKHLYLFYVVPNYDSHGAGDGHSGAKKVFKSVPKETVKITIQINNEEPMELEILAGTTLADVIKENAKHVRSIGRIELWSETFRMYGYVKKCDRISQDGERYRFEAVIKQTRPIGKILSFFRRIFCGSSRSI